MRASRTLLAASAAAVVLCGWLVVELAPTDGARPRSSSSPDAPDPAVPSAAELTRPDAEPSAALGARPTELAAAERTPEIVRSDASTLRAVRGVVRDASTQEPVPDMELSFLSRRPRTVRVVTDAAGRFESEPELAAGAVSVIHVPRGDDPMTSTRRALDPGLFILPAVNADDAARELILLARRPADVLEVAVLRPDGSPAAGAAIRLRSAQRADERAPSSASASHAAFRAGSTSLGFGTTSFEVADERGRARFGLLSEEVTDGTLCVEAWFEDALVSEIATLEPPLSTHALALALQPAAAITARVLDDAGRPIEGVEVELVRNDPVFMPERPLLVPERRDRTTDRAGEATLGTLRGGCFALSFVHPWSGERIERVLDLGRGEHATCEVHVSLLGLRPGAQGMIVDEDGRPLAGVPVRIARSNGESVVLQSGAHGEFDYWGRPDSELWLCAGAGVEDQRFEPAAMRVAFGSRGLVLRRLEPLEERTLAFEVVTRAGGEPLRDACVTLERASPAAAFEPHASVFRAPGGSVETRFLEHSDLVYVVEARGARRVAGRIAELYRRDPTRVVARIALEPGFARTFVVRERASQRPIAGARVLDQGRVVATSDAAGLCELDLARWPSALTIDAPGMRAARWEPALGGGSRELVELEPSR